MASGISTRLVAHEVERERRHKQPPLPDRRGTIQSESFHIPRIHRSNDNDEHGGDSRRWEEGSRAHRVEELGTSLVSTIQLR